MAPSRQQFSSSCKVAKRHQPYSATKKNRKCHTTKTSSSINGHLPLSPRETKRDVFREVVQRAYPYYTPRDDFEILVLSSGGYNGPPSGIVKYIDGALVDFNSREDAVREAATVLNEKANITGLKPRPGDPGVFIRPIPRSKYSIRLFPGSITASEYCLDFISTTTGDPVNSPFQHQLIAGPGPMVPLGTAPKVKLRPLDCAFGIREEHIPPGEEKFLLRDGQTCILRRPGHRDVRFTVPMRKRPESSQPEDVDVLDFPEWA